MTETNFTSKRQVDLFAARLMEHLAVAAFVLDATGRVLIWNRACERLTGFSAHELLGTKDHWMAFYDSQRPCLADLVREGRIAEAERHYAAWSSTEVNPYGLSAENWCVMPRIGRRIYVGIDVGPIYNDKGETVAVVETMRNMTAQKEMETQLVELAGRDPLTGLANRRAFDRKLADEWKRAAQAFSPTCLLLVDVDYFKQCNDNHGHSVGDDCLKKISQIMNQEALRPDDLVARIGGDEFAVILPHTPISGARIVAERIRQAVEDADLPHVQGVSTRISVSVGVASSVEYADVAEFVSDADSALYRAKAGGRNCVECAGRVTLDTVEYVPTSAQQHR
jgi:diguanylate cyclase (GGDEF)-like protein/PAS domain S-box-containing protein